MPDLHCIPAILEIRSWLPECKNGTRSVTLDGRELPRDVGATLLGPIRVLCVSPGEWLLVSADYPSVDIYQRFATNLREQGAVLIDATDGLGTLTVRGLTARDVLAKGCGLDFHPEAFPVGRCARTRFAQLPVVIDHIDDAPTFRCFVARSCQQFLADWLEDAAVEFNNDSR